MVHPSTRYEVIDVKSSNYSDHAGRHFRIRRKSFSEMIIKNGYAFLLGQRILGNWNQQTLVCVCVIEDCGIGVIIQSVGLNRRATTDQ